MVQRDEMISTTDLFTRIVAEVPAFAPMLTEHLDDNGELLPHILMGDCAQFVASHFTLSGATTGSVPTVTDVRRVLSLLDRAMSEGDDETQNVVALSFLEHLWLEPHYVAMRPLLGPALRAEIQRQEHWYNKRG